MKMKEFCEKALSNDLIGFVNNITKDEPEEVTAAYRFLLEDADQSVLEKEIERFTYANVKCFKPSYVFLVQLEK